MERNFQIFCYTERMAKHKKNNHSVLRRPMLPVLALFVAAAALTVAAILSIVVVHEQDRIDALYEKIETNKQ